MMVSFFAYTSPFNKGAFDKEANFTSYHKPGRVYFHSGYCFNHPPCHSSLLYLNKINYMHLSAQ